MRVPARCEVPAAVITITSAITASTTAEDDAPTTDSAAASSLATTGPVLCFRREQGCYGCTTAA